MATRGVIEEQSQYTGWLERGWARAMRTSRGDKSRTACDGRENILAGAIAPNNARVTWTLRLFVALCNIRY
ncbi:unnamed protein product [Danaus chrysippus]|uniref:(African queen) hypothetical protein n=1 Tax=Danaus chrysippus TaxID=151541 RepID=A0A8J2QND6_9NEOP|nr:unnamed protein product [Danaus chrysippus]